MNRINRLILIGGGGHCSSVIDTIRRMNAFGEIVITDCDIAARSELMGYKIVGNDELLPQLFQDGFKMAFISIGSIKSTIRRQEVYQRAKDIGFKFPNLIDPSASVSESVRLGEGIFIGKNAIINTNAQIADLSIINTGAIVEHGCQIGKFSHVSVGAVVCGDSYVGDSVFIGANATVIQGVEIGDNSIIGAGSVVIKDVVPNSRVVGIGNNI